LDSALRWWYPLRMDPRTSLPYTLSTIIWLATEVATVVVALLVVLPRRALAAWLMVASAGMGVARMVAGWIVPWLLARQFSTMSYMAWNAWAMVALSLWSAAGWALFLYGLVELCRSIARADAGPRHAPAPGGPA
jgi:hypothetical protein